MRQLMRGAALRIARIDALGGAVSFALRHFSRVLPIKKVYEDARMIGFLHPAPSDSSHVLIVPKARVRTVFELRDDDFRQAARAAEQIVLCGGWGHKMDQLRINGGARQDVMQAHFHLMPSSEAAGTEIGGIDGLAERLAGMDRADGLSSRGFSVVMYLNGATGKMRGEARVQY